MTSVLQVKLLGKPQVLQDEQELKNIPTKGLELLFYLLLNRTRPHDRDRLAGELWGEANPGRSKKYLRQTLWQLQAALEEQHEASPLLVLDKNWIHFNPETDLWLDVHELDQVFFQVCDLPGRSLSPAQTLNIKKAIALYQGDLLTGWYQNWCIVERERYQSILLALLDKLVEYCVDCELYDSGVDYALRLLRYDRARERTHRLLMRLYYLAGNRTAALRQFERCTAVLAADLNVKPTRTTLALHQQIRNDQPQTPAAVPSRKPAPPAPRPAGTDLEKILERLTLLQRDVRALMQRFGMTD